MVSFQKVLERHEAWLTERVVAYARDLQSHESSSIEYENWRLRMARLSASLAQAIYPSDPNGERSTNPLMDFATSEAQSCQDQGLSLGTSLGLWKRYREVYVELLQRVDLEDPALAQYLPEVHRCFDRAEIEFGNRWDALRTNTHEPSPTEGESTVKERTAENSLRESQQKLDGVVGSMTDHLIMIGDDFTIEWANDVAKGFFGQDMVGKKCREVLCYETLQCELCPVSDCMADGNPHDREMTIVRLGGEEVHFWSTANVATRHGDSRPKTYVQILRDVTELKRTQALVLQTEGLRAVAELTSGVAHNFRNLLQVIMSAARLASMEIRDRNLEEADQALEQILRTSYFGAGTIRRIEEFARPSDDMPPRPDEVFDLSLTVAQAVEMSKPWWKSKPQRQGLTVRVQHDLESGAWVKGQESQLFEVIVNLIRNAVEAFQGDGTITIKTSVRQPTILLTMHDDGPGMDPHHIQNVFDPFWTTKFGRGSGMGLATARKIVTNHQGAISVESDLGKGSTFTIQLPLVETMRPAREVKSHHATQQPLSILVIDDVEQAALFLSKALERIGHRAVSCFSGEEGLSLLSGNHFDAVICDLCMPDMNGLEVGKRIKERCLDQGIGRPGFILITGWADQELRPEETDESAVDGVLEKPADLKSIQDLVSRVVEQKQQR